MAEVIRILLADDHAILRDGLKALINLEPGLEVVGEAGTGEEAVERAQSIKPDVVVLDIDMPGIGGLEATRRITALDLGVRILVLTSQREDDFLLPVLEAGGNGFVHKRSAESEVIEAIRTVARDE